MNEDDKNRKLVRATLKKIGDFGYGEMEFHTKVIEDICKMTGYHPTYPADLSPEQDGWVNVETRMPDNGDTVDYAAVLNGEYIVSTGSFYDGNWYDQTICADCYLSNKEENVVTHWRERPSSPSEGKEQRNG